MIIENRELYYELKDCYPEFFDNLDSPIVLSRACGKSLLRTIIIMSREYTRWFIDKLKTSSVELSRKEYEAGLKTIEKIIIGNF
jgi:hypothetical protein